MITTATTDGIAEIAIDRPPANALNTELVAPAPARMRTRAGQGAGPIILTGRPGMFSGGLDVPELLPLPRPAIAEFWTAFFAPDPRPGREPGPGHRRRQRPCARRRRRARDPLRLPVGASGSFKIGLNEVAVGLPVPDGIMLALEQVVGPRLAQRLAMTAQLAVGGRGRWRSDCSTNWSSRSACWSARARSPAS